MPPIRTPRIAVRSFLSHGFMTCARAPARRAARARRAGPRSSRRAGRARPAWRGIRRTPPRSRRGVLGRGVGGQRDDRGARRASPRASARRMRRAASRPSTPGILMSIRTTSKRGVAPRVAAPARRDASSPSRARSTSKPSRRSAFCATTALMSLSSASSARFARAARGRTRRRGRRGPRRAQIRWRAARTASAREPA